MCRNLTAGHAAIWFRDKYFCALNDLVVRHKLHELWCISLPLSVKQHDILMTTPTANIQLFVCICSVKVRRWNKRETGMLYLANFCKLRKKFLKFLRYELGNLFAKTKAKMGRILFFSSVLSLEIKYFVFDRTNKDLAIGSLKSTNCLQVCILIAAFCAWLVVSPLFICLGARLKLSRK